MDKQADVPAAKVMLIYGTRPEAIKMAPLYLELDRMPGVTPIVVVTGQHREMLDQVNTLFGIEPEHDLDLMRPGASLTDISSRALAETGSVIERVSPDAVVVQGDTSTACMSGIAAFLCGVPVVHLEAGLRSGDIASPFPEEANRRLTAQITSLHLAPTPQARENLLNEGVLAANVVTTGNTVIDALREAVATPVEFEDPTIESLVASGRRYVLVTAHRRESWGQPMRSAMAGLRRVARRVPSVEFVIPMHRNPIVREAIRAEVGQEPNVKLVEPLGYHEFCHAMNGSFALLTDSGGVQEEAPSLGKPVLVMRENTERPEGVEAGTARLVGTAAEDIERELLQLLNEPSSYEAMATAANPYGDGHAAARSSAAIGELLGRGGRLPDFVPGV